MNDNPEYPTRNICADLERDALADFTSDQRDLLVTLMSRAAEAAYRRGFQQGVTIAANRPGDIRADLYSWRYNTMADDAKWADGPRVETAADRLFTEHPQLRELGLRIPIWEAIMPSPRNDPSYRARGPAKK